MSKMVPRTSRLLKIFTTSQSLRIFPSRLLRRYDVDNSAHRRFAEETDSVENEINMRGAATSGDFV